LNKCLHAGTRIKLFPLTVHPLYLNDFVTKVVKTFLQLYSIVHCEQIVQLLVLVNV